MAYVNNFVFGLDHGYDECCDDVYIDDYDAENEADDSDRGEVADEFQSGVINSRETAYTLPGNPVRLQVPPQKKQSGHAVIESAVVTGTVLDSETGDSSLPTLNTCEFWNMVKDSCENSGMRDESVEPSARGSKQRSCHHGVSSNQSLRARNPAWVEDGPHFPRHGEDRLSRQASECASLTGSDVVADSGEGLTEALAEMFEHSLTLSLSSQHSNDTGICGGRPASKKQTVTNDVQNISKSPAGNTEEIFHSGRLSEAEPRCPMGFGDGMQSKHQTTVRQYQEHSMGVDISACAPNGSVRAPDASIYATTATVPPPNLHPMYVHVPSSPAKSVCASSIAADNYESDSDNDDDDDEKDDSSSQSTDSAMMGVHSTADDVKLSAVAKILPQLLPLVAQHSAPPAIIYQTQLEMEIDFELFVPTQAFDDVLDMIKEGNKKVFLVGLPGSGKQTVARAIMRNLRNKGYSCTIVKTAEQWEKYVTGGDERVFLLPHLFGEHLFNPDHFNRWEKHLEMMSECCRHRNMVLIFTACPHIFQELNNRKSKFFDHQARVIFGEPTNDQKREILVRHLKSKSKDIKAFEDRISQIICHDQTRELFAGYCRRWIENLDDVEIDEIFQHPSVMYFDFFWGLMNLPWSAKEELVASFSLLLKGVNLDDSSDGNSIPQQCKQLGFSKLNRYPLRNFLKQFVDVLVHKGIRSFANRHAYDGVALAIGRDDPVGLVRVVDWQFLVQRCKVPEAGKKPSRRPHWPRDLIIKRVGFDEDCTKRTRQTAYCQLVRRLTDGLENPDEMMKACQHRALQACQFTEDLKRRAKHDQLLKIVLNTDRIHSQTILYWSIWNSSSFFSQWIFKTPLMECKGMQKHDVKGLVAAVILCCVFKGKRDTLEMLLKYWKKSTGNEPEALLEGRYSQVVGIRSDNTVNLPLPAEKDCLNESWTGRLGVMRRFGADCEQLDFLSGGKGNDGDKTVPCVPEGSSSKDRESVKIILPPLHIAAMCNNMEAVSLLTKKYPAILKVNDSMERSVLHISAFFGCFEIVKELLKLGVTLSKSSSGNTPLHEACTKGEEKVVELLLNDARKCASHFINATNAHGQTPLFLAVASGNFSLVHLLLQRGANEDAGFRDMSGNTFLHAACRASGNSQLVVRYLEILHVHVDARNHSLNTPMHVACHHHDDVTIVNLLTEHGADVNAPNAPTLSTPLHVAAQARHMKSFDALMDSEANIHIRDIDGKTADQYLPREKRHSVKRNSTVRVSASD